MRFFWGGILEILTIVCANEQWTVFIRGNIPTLISRNYVIRLGSFRTEKRGISWLLDLFGVLPSCKIAWLLCLSSQPLIFISSMWNTYVFEFFIYHTEYETVINIIHYGSYISFVFIFSRILKYKKNEERTRLCVKRGRIISLNNFYKTVLKEKCLKSMRAHTIYKCLHIFRI